MHGSSRKWVLLAGAVITLLLLGSLAGPCAREPPASSELARATRVAVEAANEARRQNDAAYLWPGRLRLLVVLVGIAVPLAAAVLLVYLATRHRADDLEVAQLLEKHRLFPQLPSSTVDAVPQSERVKDEPSLPTLPPREKE